MAGGTPAAGKAGKPHKSDMQALRQRFEEKVTRLLDAQDHPLREEIEAARAIVLSISTGICEGVKWNSASYRLNDYFATVNLRSRDSLQLVLHLGAKSKDNSRQLEVADPSGLLKWLASDRALLSLGGGKEFEQNRSAFERILHEWVAQL